MRFCIVLLFALLAASHLHAQYIPPRPISLTFRLYGPGARPITEKDESYRVESEGLPIDQLPASAWHRVRPLFHGNILRLLADSESSLMGIVSFSIIRGRDSMTVSSGCSIDSVGFLPGRFHIPRDYDLLLNGWPGQGVKLRPTWNDFRTKNGKPNSALRSIGGDQIKEVSSGLRAHAPGYRIRKACPFVAQKTFITWLEADSAVPRIAITTDMGESFRTIFTPFPGEQIFNMHFTSPRDGEVMVGTGYPENVRLMRTSDGGGNWSDVGHEEFNRLMKTMEWWTAGRNAQLGPNTALRLRHDVPETVALRPDMGFTWTLYSSWGDGRSARVFTAWSSGGRVQFLDSNSAAWLSPEFILLTRSRGREWEYIPFERWKGMHRIGRGSYSTLTPVIDLLFIDRSTIFLYNPRALYLARLE